MWDPRFSKEKQGLGPTREFSSAPGDSARRVHAPSDRSLDNTASLITQKSFVYSHGGACPWERFVRYGRWEDNNPTVATLGAGQQGIAGSK